MEEVKADPDKVVLECATTAKDGRTAMSTTAMSPRRSSRAMKCGEYEKCKPVLMKDKYAAVLTNVRADSPKNLLKYVRRSTAPGGTEAGYRCVESVRDKAKNPKTTARMFLFYFTQVAVNMRSYCKAVRTPHWEMVPPMPLRDYMDCLWLRVTRGEPS